MELYTVPHMEQCNLYLLSDIHCGCNNWAEKLLINDLEAIKNDPYGKVVIPGDVFQRDLKNHKVGDVYHQAISPGQQKYYMRDMLDPIKYKIIGMITGNHDDRGQEDSNEVRDLCEFIGVKYFDDELCFSLQVGKKANGKPAVYTGYGIHGCTNGQTMGALANALAKLPQVCDADFYFMGHSHQMLYFPLGWFRRDLYNKQMIPVTRHFIACGSYQGREKYPKTKAMTPKVLGSPTMRFGADKKIIKVDISNEFTI